MNRIIKNQLLILATFVFVLATLPILSLAQKPSPPEPVDPKITPHDFTNLYFDQNGVFGRAIKWRRTGADGLSVIDKAAFPYHRDVRIIVTVPAYDQSGEPFYWYPLGELAYDGFTDDRMGFYAMNTAAYFPIYLFPDPKLVMYNTIVNSRQAPLIDNTWAMFSTAGVNNPLGIRRVILVNYTEKAFTDDGIKMLQFMGDKNGFATDSSPLIKSMADLQMLLNDEYIVLIANDTLWEPKSGRYAITPIIQDPTGGAIARDAFLWMSTRDGNPLPDEMGFVTQFDCLQRLGTWCPK